MASGAGVTLDSVQIQIESTAGNAAGNIDRLAASLNNLKEAVKGGFKAASLERLAQAIDSLKSSSKGLGQTAKNLSNVSSIADSLKPLSDIKGGRGFGEMTKNLANLQQVMSSITPENLEQIGSVSKQIADKLDPLAKKMRDIADGYRGLTSMASKFNIRLSGLTKTTQKSSTFMHEFANTTKQLKPVALLTGKAMGSVFGKSTSKILGSLDRPIVKTTKKIKQMGMALLSVRSIFTFVRKAINEYLQLDDELQKSLTNTWRAMGAQLAPAVEFMANLFHQFVRVIYSVILALTGIDLIARANEKTTKGWGKSIKDALGNLQKFDDLNVVEFPKSSGGLEDKLIDMQTIDLSPIQKVIDWVKKLRDEIKAALDTGEWENVGKVFGEGIDAGLKFAVKGMDILTDKLRSIGSKFGDFLNGAVSQVDFSNIGQLIFKPLIAGRGMITSFFEKVKWDIIGQKINDAVQNIDFAGVISSFANMWKIVAGSLLTALKEIDFSELGLRIHDAILNADWKGLFTNILGLLKEVIVDISETVLGIFGIDTKNWKDLSKVLVTIAGTLGVIGGLTIVKWLIAGGIGGITGAIGKLKDKITGTGKSVGDVAKKGTDFTKFFDKLGTATEIIAVLGGVALVISQITNMINALSESGLKAQDAALVIGVAFGAIAAAFAGIAAATKLLDPSDTLEVIAIMASMALALSSVSLLLMSVSAAGMTTGDVLGLLATVFGSIVAMMAVVAFLGPKMTAGLVPFSVLMLEISAVLAVMAITLPIILDAAANFIERTAPKLCEVLEVIFEGIDKIIRALGDVLPPIIESVGHVFDSIFGGISLVIQTVGNVIIGIFEAIGKTVETVLGSIIRFVGSLGPAIENSVDAIIRAVTKLINFMISGVEYLINTLIVGSINALIRNANKVADFLDFLGLDIQLSEVRNVNIPRFAPKLETGTNEIPNEGLYHLHPGEAVVPKKYNPALGNGTNEETNQRLDTLIDLIENLSFTNVVNVGNEQLYKQQARFDKQQNNKYGVVIK